MVLYVIKWNISPEVTAEAYDAFTQRHIPATVGGPGVVEFRGYRPVTGPHEVVVTYEFANLEDWAAWRQSDVMRAAEAELRKLGSGVTMELWGHSEQVPEPVRPRG